MELIGVALIIIGFALRLDTIGVVLIAGMATGFVVGMDFVEILNILGKAFVDTRYMSLFLLTLAVIGILERNGLRESAAKLIRKLNRATSGRVVSAYMVVRIVFSMLSLRVQGHVQFVRPLIYPMAKGAIPQKISSADDEKLKALCNANENYGNFFGQNVFIAAPGILLIIGTLAEKGISVNAQSLSLTFLPIAILATFYSILRNLLWDKHLAKENK